MGIHTRFLKTRVLAELTIALLLSGIVGGTTAFAADVAGSKDHPLISRYEGSDIFKYKTEAFNEYPLFIYFEFSKIKHTYVADGHHRTAAAALVGKELRDENPNHTGDEEYNFFLALHSSAIVLARSISSGFM